MAHVNHLNSAASSETLVICRPFTPSVGSDGLPYSFYFVELDNLDPETVAIVAEKYPTLLVERSIVRALQSTERAPPEETHVLDDVVFGLAEERAPRVLFLASNDTHAHFMISIASKLKKTLFVIPKLSRKDERASARLDDSGINYVEIDYADRESTEIEIFAPDIVLSAADWTSEFIAVHRIAQKLSIPTVSLQEGPQDWQMTIKGRDPMKYRNAEIFFAQGAVTLKYIRPKYFAVTGNPKIDRLDEKPMPLKPKVFINCNFTYGEWEDSRDLWMGDVLSICQDLGLDYLISKHPRDPSEWDDPNLVESSAFSVREQLISSSIIISRFSSIPYEGLSLGRPVVYYNPHGETPRTFNDDASGGIHKAMDRHQLRAILQRHQQEMSFDRQRAIDFLHEHCGPLDGQSINRIVNYLTGIVSNQLQASKLRAEAKQLFTSPSGQILFSVIICTHNRAHMLDRVIRSVLKTPWHKIPYEVLVVDNASTDDTEVLVRTYLETGIVKYIEEPELGLSRARNTGVSHAEGKFVVFLDDDGEVEVGWLEAFLQVLEEHPEAAACGGRVVPEYEISKPVWISGISERFYGDYDLGDEVNLCDWVPGGNCVWRKNILESLGGYNPKFGRKGQRILVGGEESQLIKQALDQGYSFYYSPDATMHHHVPANRVTVRYLANRWLGQGITDFRYRELKEEWSRKRLFVHWRIASVNFVSQFGKLLGSLFTGQKKRMTSEFFQFAYRSGVILEAIRFGISGEYKLAIRSEATSQVE